MKRSLVLTAVVAAAVAAPGSVRAAEVPFPAPQVKDVAIVSQNVTTGGVVTNFFSPGSTVVFRAYAVDGKTRKALGAKDVKYFYVTIPGRSNVRLRYAPTAPGASRRFPWSGTWTVPAAQPLGVVQFRILIKTESKRYGQYVQIPVLSSQLTIRATVDPTFTAGTIVDPAPTLDNPQMSLYVDAVNGSRPTGAAPRPVGCTQSNVFKRGEQFVIRAWGADLTDSSILSSENVREAYYSVPGQPNVTLPWGPHGAASNRVWFWAAAWNIPGDYPLGEATVRVVFTLESGKTGSFDYRVTIIP